MTVKRPKSTKDTAAALTQTFPALYTGVPCRAVDLNAGQQFVYAMRQQTVNVEVHTEQDGIAVGDVLVLSDGRKAKVEGVRKARAMGSIPTFFIVSANELRPGA